MIKLERTTRSVVAIRLERILTGNFGDCKMLKGRPSIWELRIDYGPGYRIYFSKEDQTVIILLIGGDKKTQEKDITKAQRYLLDYKGRK
jgi:putative addiction module killer protein